MNWSPLWLVLAIPPFAVIAFFGGVLLAHYSPPQVINVHIIYDKAPQ